MVHSHSESALIVGRLDRLPHWPYGRALLWIVGAGYFFGFFDVVNIGFALPVISKQFHVTAAVAATAISIGLVGYIIGSYLNSTVSDLYGRKLGLTLSVSLFTIGSLLSTFSPNLTWLDQDRAGRSTARRGWRLDPWTIATILVPRKHLTNLNS